MDPFETGGDAEGLVEQTLPKGLFRVRLDSGAVVRAAMSSHARKIIIKIVPGDRVLVKVHPNDPTRGRITQQLT